MNILKRIKSAIKRGGSSQKGSKGSVSDASSENSDIVHSNTETKEEIGSFDSFVNEGEYDDFAEEETFGDELVRRFVSCSSCFIPGSVRTAIVDSNAEAHPQDDEISLEDATTADGAQSSKQIEDSKSVIDKKELKRKEKLKALSRPTNDEDLIEAITDILPQCQDGASDFVKNELHILIKKQRWITLQQKLSKISKYEHLKLLIRQRDGNGRTPLSLACGKSQAPREIIELLLRLYPDAAGIEDRNANLPLHHFCHSYGRQSDDLSSPEDGIKDTSDYVMILKMIHEAYSDGIKCANSYGNTPLHVYIEHEFALNVTHSSLNLTRALLKLNPAVASIANRSGSFPMHYIGKNTINLSSKTETATETSSSTLVRSFIKDLHNANPNAVMALNNFGATPFLVAVIYNASFDIWQELLTRYPAAAKVQNSQGGSPISLHWNMFVSVTAKKQFLNLLEKQAYEEAKIVEKNKLYMSRISCLQDLRLNSPTRLIDFWMKMELMLRAASNGTTSSKLPSGEPWSPLHAICTYEECPGDVLKFALQMYGGDIDRTDNKGNMPLHALLQSLPINVTARQTKEINAMIEHLIFASPTTVSRRTPKGQLPLHLALRSNITWNAGIQSLVNTNKATAEIRDPVTKLFPFMQAAVCDQLPLCSRDDEDDEELDLSKDLEKINTIYGLLVISPGLAHTKPKREKPLLERGAEVLRVQRRREQERDLRTKKKILELQRKVKNLQRKNEVLGGLASIADSQYELLFDNQCERSVREDSISIQTESSFLTPGSRPATEPTIDVKKLTKQLRNLQIPCRGTENIPGNEDN
eukprot:CAMPEP_0172427542 /NCGR_PEP_ID=MMETSP1064-20121228/42467_1 /TAXON_ID=202472 /ORGANISM="Aulacoseira subarctica , Strain CCAP 1002/5" /LENGTH=813 /DNA_ID=CAMNT_0013171785 /DNA_START=32 /DNA_END=2471 /DNA_ORIENTATION=+